MTEVTEVSDSFAHRAGAKFITIDTYPGDASHLADVALFGNTGDLVPQVL